MTTADREGLAARVRAARSQLQVLGPAVTAGEPWPLSAHIGTEPETTWGPLEVLAHLAEMIPFWHGEIERVLAELETTEPPPFGRTAEDTLRIALIERDRHVPSHELLGRIDTSLDRLAGRIARLDLIDGDRRAVHRTRGERSVADFIDLFLVSHVEEHIRQLDAVVHARD